MAYMSQEGYDKLVAEMKQLVAVERPRHQPQLLKQETRVT